MTSKSVSYNETYTNDRSINSHNVSKKTSTIRFAALATAMLIAGNTTAGELSFDFHETTGSPEVQIQNRMNDWSATLTTVLNKQMDNKLQQIASRTIRLDLVEDRVMDLLASNDKK